MIIFMKKITIILYCLFCVLLLHSCVEEKMPYGGQFANSPYSLKVNRATLTLSAKENLSGSIVVNSKNTPWEITGIPSWLEVSPHSGSADAVVTVTATPNSSTTDARVAVLDFHSTAEEYTFVKAITVTQKKANVDEAGHSFVKKDAFATVDTDVGVGVFEFATGQAQGQLAITGEADWSATVSDEWIALSQYHGNGGESVVISVQGNNSEMGRTGAVTIVADEQLIRLSIVQQGQYHNINSAAGELEADGGCIDLTVSTSFGTVANIEYHGESKDWVAVENDGKGNYTLRVACNPSANSRTAQFVIKPSRNTAHPTYTGGVKLNITQRGMCE